MPTPKDQQRVEAFRAFARQLGRDQTPALMAEHGVSGRTLQRLLAGSRPPAARLLDQLATAADARGWGWLATQLRDAASPAEAPHG